MNKIIIINLEQKGKIRNCLEKFGMDGHCDLNRSIINEANLKLCKSIFSLTSLIIDKIVSCVAPLSSEILKESIGLMLVKIR